MGNSISSKKQMREENISTSQSSFQDLVNRTNSELKSLKKDLVAASLIHCDDEKIYDLSKKFLTNILDLLSLSVMRILLSQKKASVFIVQIILMCIVMS